MGITYKGYVIEDFKYGYIVRYCGDEIVVPTIAEARELIDELSEAN